jgi:glycine dehydrogenase subunit 1
VAALGAARAAELEAALAGVGAERIHPGPYLNEFAVRVPDAPTVHRRMLDRGVLAGLALADAEPDDPTLADGLLVCATEVTTPEEIGRFADTLGQVLAGRPPTGVEAGAGADRSPSPSPVAAGSGARGGRRT